jgi:hypothetical protein
MPSGGLRDDPFARLLPTVVVELGPGLVGAAKPPASLVLERYGGTPWPGRPLPGRRAVRTP